MLVHRPSQFLCEYLSRHKFNMISHNVVRSSRQLVCQCRMSDHEVGLSQFAVVVGSGLVVKHRPSIAEPVRGITGTGFGRRVLRLVPSPPCHRLHESTIRGDQARTAGRRTRGRHRARRRVRADRRLAVRRE